MKVYECNQYDDSWWRIRRGIPTASEFSNIITPKTGEFSKGAEKYICQLIGDLYDPLYPRKDSFATAAMRHGTAMEPASRFSYEQTEGVKVQQVGFCMTEDGRFGCSPDFLAGEDGVGELKNPQPATHAEWVLGGVVPSDYIPQVHGHLVVTGRKWCDFVSYCQGFPDPMFKVRVYPDEYTEKLKAAMETFWKMYQEALAKFKAMEIAA